MVEVQARTVLWYLVFVGFAVNYMIRINLNITIVEMVSVKQQQTSRIYFQVIDSVTINSTEALASATNEPSRVLRIAQENFTNENYPLEQHTLNWTNANNKYQRFHWNEYQQGLVLGSFFWAHWITQIPGGILAKKYGTKLVFGLSNAIGCWMCFAIPVSSRWDYRALISLRILQGLITGLAWPAMHVMTANWIPPNERSKFVTAYLGSSLGIALFYPLFGYILHWFTWEWVFHLCGIIGSFWWICWLYFVFDTPAEHPRINESEVRYIKKSLGASIQTRNESPTPWKEILLSLPVWMNVIAQWGGIWGLFTLMTQAPTYFRVVHNWNIRATGILSGLPHFMRMLFALGFSMIADFLLRTKKMSRTNLRKMATAVCCILKGLVVVALAYAGHNSLAAIVLLTVATMLHGAVSSGPLASIVDIAPNYAGIVLGISGMIGVLPGFISPYIVGILTVGNQSFESWKSVFLICAAMLIGSGVLYVLFAESTIQSWNNISKRDDKEFQLIEKEVALKVNFNERKREDIS